MRAVRRSAIPVLVFLLGLIATVAAATLVARTEAGRRQARFEGLVNSVAAAVESRMLSQLTLLRGAAGLFNASDDVSREEFQAYVSRLRLQRNYPGVLGIGYAAFGEDRQALQRLPWDELASGSPAFPAWPEGERPGYSAIVYLEPMNRLNRRAIGYDMMSEPTRRKAMEDARRSGVSRLSGKVRLVQEIEPVKQPGFLIYLPLYREDDGVSDGADEGFYGWVYSPLRAFDLFGATFSLGELSDIVVEIYDSAVDEERLLYRSAAPQESPAFDVSRRVEIAGRPWIVRVSSSEHFESGSPLLLSILVMAGGTLISLLLAALMLQQVRAAARVERQVALRTAELSEANSRLIAEGHAREAAEAQIRQMQKMEAVGQLTGGIAHDFNNMLAVILGNIDMAERRRGEPERLGRALANARQGAVKAAELTQRLLAFARRQALAATVVDLNKLVLGMSELLRRSLGETVQLETFLADGLWRVEADATQLESAILNLAINALDAMDGVGVLTIATANARLDENEGDGDGEAADFVLLTITDTGRGMSPELAERAVEPFFTTKEVGRGTGLGLSQVYGFVTQSGGQLKIDSEPGVGTAIRIHLPRRQGGGEPEPPPAAPAQEIAQSRGAEVVLVVEDEDQVREMSVDTLAELGYTVLAAASGEEALWLLDQRPDVRLLFTDVVMPGMNGRELAQAARDRMPGVKVLFTTGYARDAIVREGRLEEGIAVIQKPFAAADLARRIRETLDS
jgi:CHASE1-domain containing sensor protein/CheY-like chemotaxis protein